METYATAKGQIVIPSALRRKYGIKVGAKILVFDDGESIILKPVTEDYWMKLQGSLRGSGAVKILVNQRAKDKEHE